LSGNQAEIVRSDDLAGRRQFTIQNSQFPTSVNVPLVQGQRAGELTELLAQHEPAAMQA
jgi:hypothetical protein